MKYHQEVWARSIAGISWQLKCKRHMPTGGTPEDSFV
jgi:hypothetical protein